MSVYKRQLEQALNVAEGAWRSVEQAARSRHKGMSQQEAIEAELAGLVSVYVLALQAAGKLDDQAMQERVWRLTERAVDGGLVSLPLVIERRKAG